MAGLAHGRAIVTTPPCVPLPHFVNGENMIWPKQADAAMLAELIHEVHTDATLRMRLEEGSGKLASHFSWPSIAEDTNLVFGEALSKRT